MSFNCCYAKSLQSCLTLCDPRDGSPPGSPVPGILQARTLEWVAISFSKAWKWKVKVKLLGHVDSSRPHGPWPTRLRCPWNFPGKILEWVAISFSRGSSWPRDQTHISSISCIGRRILYHWAIWGAPKCLHTSVNFFLEYWYHCMLEKEMAIASSIIVWRIPWTEEPDGLQFMGSQKRQMWLSD